MYGRDEYHHARAQELLDAVERLVSDAEPETRAALEQMLPKPLEPGVVQLARSLGMGALSSVARQMEAQRAHCAPPSRPGGVFSGLFGNTGL